MKIPIHPEEDFNVFTKFNGNPSNSNKDNKFQPHSGARGNAIRIHLVGTLNTSLDN